MFRQVSVPEHPAALSLNGPKIPEYSPLDADLLSVIVMPVTLLLSWYHGLMITKIVG